jgi:hypothetical protein
LFSRGIVAIATEGTMIYERLLADLLGQPGWLVVELARLACGGPQARPSTDDENRAFLTAKDRISRAMRAREIPSTRFRPADPTEAAIGEMFYENDRLIPRNAAVIAWMERTFPAFPADVAPIETVSQVALDALGAAIADEPKCRTKWLNDLVAGKGWTVTMLADNAGVDRGNIYDWTRGRTKRLTTTVKGKLATALGVPIEQFPE